MMSDLAAADAAGDSELAHHIAGKIKAVRETPQPEPAPSGLDKLANGPPSTLGLIRQGADWLSGKQAEADARDAQEHPAAAPYLKLFSALGSMGAGAGLSRSGTVLPKSMSAKADPVLQQIRRVNAVSGSEPSGGLPALPKVLDWVLPGKLTKTYEFLRKATQQRGVPESPYPAEAGGEASQWRPAGPAPERAPAPLTPELQAAAEASRARVLSRISPASEVSPATAEPQATPAPAPTPPPAQAPAPAPPSPFEAAGRAKKVAELTKAIDANASAHLGVDPQDPRFGEALAGLPPEWWEGMGQVAKVNKPSPQTISEVLKFYQDRASQRGSVLPLSRSAK
jgi:hypothetical protein